MVKKNTGSSGPGGRYKRTGAGGSQIKKSKVAKRKLMLGLNKEFFKIDSKYVVH